LRRRSAATAAEQARAELGLSAIATLGGLYSIIRNFGVWSTVKMHLLMHLQAGGMAVRTFLGSC
jgi:hypothetical protein